MSSEVPPVPAPTPEPLLVEAARRLAWFGQNEPCADKNEDFCCDALRPHEPHSWCRTCLERSVAEAVIAYKQPLAAPTPETPETPTGWQPIESGPESERVLVIFQRGSFGFGCRVRDENDKLIWTDDDTGEIIGPVGWMSLKALPLLASGPATPPAPEKEK